MEAAEGENTSVGNLATDVYDPEKRSKVMAAVRSKNTKPELIVRSGLHLLGYRFRLHVKGLPGRPDIVLRKSVGCTYPIVVSNTVTRCAGNPDYWCIRPFAHAHTTA